MYSLQEVKDNIEQNVTGKIVAVHSMDKHRYRLQDGSIVDSVTQRNIIDKPHLIPWAVGLAIDFLEQEDRFQQLKGPTRDALILTAKFLHRDNRDEAGTIGGKAHEVIEFWLQLWMENGVRPEPIVELLKRKGIEDHRVWGSARSAEAAFDKYKAVPVAAEILVGWNKEGAGTLDLLVLNDKGELELWDWKTSNNINDFYAMQVSAYRRYFMKMTGLKIARVRIFKLDKGSDRYHCYNVPYPNKAYAAFRGISKAYDWLEASRKKLIEDKNRIVI